MMMMNIIFRLIVINVLLCVVFFISSIRLFIIPKNNYSSSSNKKVKIIVIHENKTSIILGIHSHSSFCCDVRIIIMSSYFLLYIWAIFVNLSFFRQFSKDLLPR